MTNRTVSAAFTNFVAVSVGLMLLAGCSTYREPAPLSKNGCPLSLSVIRAFVPNEPQFEIITEHVNLRFSSGNASSSYTGPVKSDKQILSAPQHSPVVVEFKITNVTRNLLMKPEDFQLFDGKGGVHEAKFERDRSEGKANRNRWNLLEPTYLFPKAKFDNVAPISVLFRDIPDNAIEGSSIHFQGSAYLLPIGK